GGCSFCAISAHQGKYISSRSPKSILKELDKVVEMPDFKGNVSDLGGPSANMYMMQGIDQEICNKCSRSSCLFPSICNNLNYNHTNLLNLYREAEKVKGVKRIFIGSGIRYDMLYKDNRFTKDGAEYARHVIKNNVSGRLKVAPEHTEPHILKLMRKPSITLYNDFQKFFMDENQKIGKKQQLIPYFISSHPGCTIEDMFNLHGETSKNNIQTEQIQDFTPTPMTLATVMFYSGINPYTGESLYVAHDLDEKRVQKGFFFINDFKKRSEIQQYLRKTRKTDILKQLNRNISMGQNKKHRK
ncbi:MAG: DUF3362 domain-containing protein, partial [Salinivirgaceae bacterium]|nr:DUF3362 domain-containing protein [Salinivirgaceae bacterium]